MRAYEIIIENKKPHKRASAVMPAAHHVSGTNDRTYDLNRVMMAVAGADGKTKPISPKESWTGRHNTAHPYTEIEHKMLKDAYDVTGVIWSDLIPHSSKEPEDTYIISPVTSFKGYQN